MSQKSSKYILSFKEKLFLKFGTPFIALFVKLMCISYRLVACGNEKEAKEACEQIRLDLELKLNEMTDQCDTRWGDKPFGKPGFDLPKV